MKTSFDNLPIPISKNISSWIAVVTATASYIISSKILTKHTPIKIYNSVANIVDNSFVR